MPSTLYLLTFRLAQLRCGLRVNCVREILPLPWITSAPGQPAILEGFFDLHGTIVPVVRMAALFGLSAPAAAEPHIILLRGSGSPWGLLVDATEDVLAISDADLRPISAQYTVNQCTEAEFIVDGKEFALLDSERIILAEESRRIADLRGQMERRVISLDTVS